MWQDATSDDQRCPRTQLSIKMAHDKTPWAIFNSPDKSIGRTFRAVFVLPLARRGEKIGKRKPSRTYRNPLFVAREWKKMLESGEYASQSDLARKVGASRARVNQMLRLLKLPREIQDSVIQMGDPLSCRKITERELRDMLAFSQPEEKEGAPNLGNRFCPPQTI